MQLKQQPRVAQDLFSQAKSYAGLAQPHLSDDELKSDCRSALETIETQPLAALIESVVQKKIKLDSKCLFLSQKQTEFLKGFPEVCEISEQSEPSAECLQKIFYYKVLRVHTATIGQNLEQLPTEVLIQKLMAVLMGQLLSSADDLKQLKQLGVKLYERLPESESAAKAASIGYLVDDHLSSEEQAVYNKTLRDARNKFPENWEIYEMDLVRRKAQNDPEYRSEITRYYQAHSQSAIGQYYMGCLEWADGHEQSARDFFKAASQASTESRFLETYQKALSQQSPSKVCSVKINFDPDKF